MERLTKIRLRNVVIEQEDRMVLSDVWPLLSL